MRCWKALAVMGLSIVLTQVASPDTIYFKDRTIIKDCKILEHHKVAIKVQTITGEPEAPEPLTKETWYPRDLILKIEYENGLVEYMETDWRTYAHEFIVATTGELIGVVGGCCGSYLFLSAEGLPGAKFITATGLFVGAACGVTITGKRLKEKGSFWLALGGSVTLGLLPISFYLLYDNFLPLLTLPIAIPLGAVVGYNCGK